MFSKDRLDKLLNQPMSRRDFLRNVGILIISIVGFGSALNILATGQSHNSHRGIADSLGSKHTFGSSKFGA